MPYDSFQGSHLRRRRYLDRFRDRRARRRAQDRRRQPAELSDRPDLRRLQARPRRSSGAIERGDVPCLSLPGQGTWACRPDDAACDAFQLAVLRWQPFSDSVEALKRLRTKFRLVAMTNADRVALSCYAHALGDPFDDTVCADDTGVAKPNPEFFAYNKGRQAAFGYKQSDILHVAQSQYHDIGIARKLGYKVCWIERRQGQAGFWRNAGSAGADQARFPFRLDEGVRRRCGRKLKRRRGNGAGLYRMAPAASLWASTAEPLRAFPSLSGEHSCRCRHHRCGLHRALGGPSYRQERTGAGRARGQSSRVGARAAATAASSPQSFGSRSATSTPPMAAPWPGACTRSRMKSVEIVEELVSEFGITAARLTRNGPGQGRAQCADASRRPSPRRNG